MPPTTGAPADQQQGTTAERLAAAARRIVESEGASAVSVRRIAAEVALTPMAVYRHYPSREALLEHVADELFAELGRQWAAVSWDGDPDAGFGAALSRYLDFALTQPRLYTFLFTEVRAHARRFPADFHEDQSPTLTVLAHGLATGMARGVLRRDDPWELALLVSAQLHGLVQLHLGGRLSYSDADFRALCARVMGRILRGFAA